MPKSETLELSKIQSAWDCYLCALPKFPVPVSKRPALAKLLAGLSSEIGKRFSLQLCTLLQFLQLQNDKGSDILTENGKRWLPEMGLGIWPDRDPPRQFDKKSFFSFPPGYKRPVLMYQLFRITAADGAREEACELMVGRGIVQLMFSPMSDKELLETGRSVLLPRIDDPSFREFPFYLPMLSGTTFGNGTAEQLNEWSCGAPVCIRESVEDKGLLIASREPLAPVFEALGGQLDEESGAWSIPVEIEEQPSR